MAAMMNARSSLMRACSRQLKVSSVATAAAKRTAATSCLTGAARTITTTPTRHEPAQPAAMRQEPAGVHVFVENPSPSSSNHVARTVGLSKELLAPFANDPDLNAALEQARERIPQLKEKYPEYFEMDELEAGQAVSSGFESFYLPATKSPYIPAASKGPWIVTIHGAVLHDSGGYGMLGFGHSPEPVLEAMREEQTMANVMGPHFEQKRFTEALLKEFSSNRSEPVYGRFMCLNSGSEGVELSLRISDAHAKKVAPGKKSMVISMKDGFHGRTYRAATVSESCKGKYVQTLHSFGGCTRGVRHVEWNDVADLEQAFKEANDMGVHVECVICEPVQGEGLAGLALSKDFYLKARELTLAHESFLIVDSVQAAGRAYGHLSFLNSEEFADVPGADIEVFSKAINAGQYPLSLLGLGKRAEGQYAIGTYGNTMTTNPRALSVGVAVLDMMTNEVKQNIKKSGQELIDKLKGLWAKYPGVCTNVTGTGMMSCLHLDPKYPVVGEGGLETEIRMQGISFIHGGENGMRFTPHFRLSSKEVDLIISVLDTALAKRANA